MLVRRCWFDLKWRFFWAVGFSLFYAANFIRNYLELVKLKDSGSVSNHILNPDLLRVFSAGVANLYTRITEDYLFYTDFFWFMTGISFFGLFAIILALGGILVQKNKSALHLTLSLPVKRPPWLMVHAGITALLVFVLIFGSTISVLAVTHVIGEYYPLGVAMTKALFVWLLCLPWIGLSLLANSFFHNGFKSIMTLIVFLVTASYLELPGLRLLVPFKSFDLYTLHQFLPWKELIIAITATVVTISLAMWRFGRNEY